MFGTIPKWKTVDYIKIQHKNDIKINVKETNLLGHDVNEYAWKNKNPPKLELNLPDYHGCKSVKKNRINYDTMYYV